MNADWVFLCALRSATFAQAFGRVELNLSFSFPALKRWIILSRPAERDCILESAVRVNPWLLLAPLGEGASASCDSHEELTHSHQDFEFVIDRAFFAHDA